MLDLQHLPLGRVCDVQIFRSGTPVGGARWNKPRGCSHVFILLGSGGGGGGGGASGLTLTQRGGGGGGSSGVVFRGLFPLIVLPDYLVIKIGTGNIGGAADTDGADSAANANTTLYWPTTSSAALNVSGANNGSKGTSSVGGAAGGAAGAATITGALAQLGIIMSTVAIAGRAGSATTTPTALAATFFSGGGGGAGTDTSNNVGSGGDVTSSYSNYPNVIGGVGALLGTGDDGNDGYSIIPADLYGGLSSGTPLFCIGGSGGGADGSAGVGGRGGNGGQCCGGGGGGGGITGGVGGRGGDGLAIFVSF